MNRVPEKKWAISIYGYNYDQVHTVTSRLSALTTIPIVSHINEVQCKFYILESTTRQAFAGAACYNHCVDTNDFIDDDYIISIWDKAIRFFFPKDYENEKKI